VLFRGEGPVYNGISFHQNPLFENKVVVLKMFWGMKLVFNWQEASPIIVFIFKSIDMKALLVLTDFSPAANSAADYACELAAQLAIQRIILYHSHQVPIPVSEAVIVMTDEAEDHLTSLRKLKELEELLRKKILWGYHSATEPMRWD